MFLTCRDNRRKIVAAKYLPPGTPEYYVLPLTLGKSYPVVGMSMQAGVLYFLVPNDALSHQEAIGFGGYWRMVRWSEQSWLMGCGGLWWRSCSQGLVGPVTRR